MDIYTNTTRPTPGHDKANILVIPGANIIVVNATFCPNIDRCQAHGNGQTFCHTTMTISWPNHDQQMEVGNHVTCSTHAPFMPRDLEVLEQHFNLLVYTGNEPTKNCQKWTCHLMQRTVN